MNKSIGRKRRMFLVCAFFFFAVLTNPRDFPMNNIPLIYPAFVLFAIVVGPHNLRRGFRRTRFLCLALLVYWAYLHGLRVLQGYSLRLSQLPYLLEPLMILIMIGAAAVRLGSSRILFAAVSIVIIFSTFCGLWIYFIGEPVASWHLALHKSIGGNIVEGQEFVREQDEALYTGKHALHVQPNSGLSRFPFIFSYQLSAGFAMLLLWGLYRKNFTATFLILLWGGVGIFILGILTNAERASIISIITSIFLFFTNKAGTRKIRFFILIVLVGLLSLIILEGTEALFAKRQITTQSLQERVLFNPKVYTRIYMGGVAVISGLLNPLGSAGISDYYRDIAYRVKWYSFAGPVSSHNHFGNTIMYTGFIGIGLTVLLWQQLYKRIQYVHRGSCSEEAVIFAPICLGLLVHSLMHNAGFFVGEPATIICFGFLWVETAYARKRPISEERIASPKQNRNVRSNIRFHSIES